VEPARSALARHIEACAPCQATVRTLAGNDTLADASRAAPETVEKFAGAPPGVEPSDAGGPREGDARDAALTVTRDVAPGGVDAADAPLDFLAPPQRPDEVGRLGAYRVLKVLGHGGMGVVLLADDPELDRRVALKVMLPRVAANPAAKQRFLREARAAAKLNSDHIVTIYQVGEDRGVPFLVMELLEGAALDRVLKSGRPLTLAQILGIGLDVAKGLAAAHAKGLIHRDIKPGNLWLDAAHGNRVKILDFGLARAEQDDVHLTQSGAIIGTPSYMAPEQARGDKPVDARADLFSLGCVLYRLAAGDIPFKSESAIGVLLAMATADAPDPRRLNAAIPADLAVLVMQLLDKDPAERPASARVVIERLTAIANARLNRRDDPTSIVLPRRAGPESAPGRKRAVAAGALLVGLVAAAGVALFRPPTAGFDGESRAVTDASHHRVVGEKRRPDKAVAPFPAAAASSGGPRLLATLRTRGAAGHLAFSPDWDTRPRFLIAGGETFTVFDLGPAAAPDALIAAAVLHQERMAVTSMAASADGKRLAVGSVERGAFFTRVLELPGRKTVAVFQPKHVPYTVALSPDGRTVVYGDAPGLMVRDVPGDSAHTAVNAVEGRLFTGLSYSPDGRYVVGIHYGAPSLDTGTRLVILDAKTRVRIGERAVEGFAIRSHISFDGNRVLVPGGTSDNKPVWRLFGLPAGDLVHAEKNLPSPCVNAAFAPGRGRFAVAFGDGTVQIWDGAGLKMLTSWAVPRPAGSPAATILSVAFSPDGDMLATGGATGEIQLWDLTPVAASGRAAGEAQ